MDARRTEAKNNIAEAQYTGRSKRFGLNSYINVLQANLNELEACGEPYSGRKQVDTFVKGLLDRFKTTRDDIIQNSEMRNDFVLTYSHVQTMEGFVGSGLFAGNETGNRTLSETSSGKRSFDSFDTSYCSFSEWKKKSKDEQDAIRAERQKLEKRGKKQGNGGGKGGGKGKDQPLKQLSRKLSEVMAAKALESLEASDGTGSSGGESHGGSGGRKVRGLRKAKHDVH